MRQIFCIVCLSMILSACNSKEKIETYHATYDEEKQIAAQEILTDNGKIEEANIIIIDDKMLVAVQVKPWLRLKKQSIEKDITEKLEEAFPNLELIISTDFKIFWESSKLITEEDTQKIRDEVDNLKKLSKEET
ncbi:YhcN/YlaJ family sporulation lipoprotein [Lysinibacillus sp. 54212]|uniref:YhcN/YlaJ family sporulation lipoprotein n=1 Tax=Lysinibacillus sp. 54212 TaxID=3119829 RepID=UPI002FCB792A